MSATLDAVMTEIKSLGAKNDALQAEINELKAVPAGGAGGRDPRVPLSAPAARSGEDALSSRGYSLLKMVGLASGVLSRDEAKVELGVHSTFQKELDRIGYVKAATNTVFVPFCLDYLPTDVFDNATRNEIRDVWAKGVTGLDADELVAVRRQVAGLRQKAMSWLDESVGGALVAPPVMGELIEVYRNNLALDKAGCRMIGLPPNGRITWPRQTTAMTAYWVGESQQITSSDPGTGDVTLQAKKLGVLCKLPNELFKFSTVAVEQFVREDMMKVMAIEADKTFLESPGSSVKPKGIINYSNITTHTASTTGANGDTFTAEDVGLMVGKVEEKNATFQSWIMRPLMYTALANRRAGSGFAADDGKGMFLFNMLRDFKDSRSRERGVGTLEGYPCVKSTNVSNTRVKGGSSALTYILGGDFSNFVVAGAGVLEFIVAREGDTMVQNDQTWVRGIHYTDAAVLREAAFALCDTLVVG